MSWERGLRYPRTCEICKIEFKVGRYMKDKSKYCSQQCHGKAKIGKPTWNKGKPHTAIKGDKNPKWVSDRTKIKRQDRHDNPLYKTWRRSVLTRDNFTCQKCGFRGWPLHADHIKSYAMYPESRFDLENGRTLCIPCHKKTDSWGRPERKTLEMARQFGKG